MFDCIIVGAGPAGGTAAYHLARRGRSVLVLEKDSLPRYKPCGGGVSPAIQDWFDFDFSPVISTKARNVRYTWKLDDPIEAQLQTPEPMWMVRRDVFDHFLIQQAQQKGAELRDNTTVTGIEFKGSSTLINTSAGTFEGRYLIAADGAKGPMAKWLGFKDRKSRSSVVFESEVLNANPTVSFDFGLLKNGYIWNMPKADGASLSIATLRGGESSDLNSILSDYARKIGIDPKKGKSYTYPICLWEGTQKLHAQNALLVGEAAAIVDPFSAEGIRPGMYSGMKAAEAIASALDGVSDALENYTQLINEEWGSDMKWAQRLSGAFFQFPKIGYKVGIKRPTATERMGQILCGELRYSDVAGRALKRLGGGLIPGMGGG